MFLSSVVKRTWPLIKSRTVVAIKRCDPRSCIWRDRVTTTPSEKIHLDPKESNSKLVLAKSCRRIGFAFVRIYAIFFDEFNT